MLIWGWTKMLEIKDLHVSYGGIQALRGVSLNVPDGKIVTLIGANGAGKSTLMRTISGLVKAQSGSILWNGQELLGKPIDQIVASGIAMSPEGRRVFADLTVVENLKIGAYLRKDKAETEKDLEWVYSLFPRLKERSWQSAGTLSGDMAMPLATIWSMGLPSSSCPFHRMEPLCALTRPEMVRIRVDLPAPLAPIRVTILPSGTFSDTPRRA